MKTLVYFFLISMVSLNLACSSSDDEGNELTKDGTFPISELTGDWEATKAQFSVNTTSVDLIEQGGTATMTVQSNGKFTLTLSPYDRDTYSVGGEFFWEEWQQTFYLAIVWDDEPDDWDTYGHTFDGLTLSINGGADTGAYDFDNDGDLESCSLHFIFNRL